LPLESVASREIEEHPKAVLQIREILKVSKLQPSNTLAILKLT
jgi:hypothetical protein